MELDLKDYLKIIRKRIWLLLVIVMVSSLAAGVVSYYYLKPVYQASTKLIVNKSTDPSQLGELNLNDVNLNIRIIDTYKEVIKTPYIMEIVAKQHPELQVTAEQLIGMVKVNAVNNTQVMTLTVQDQSHDRAVQIVNAVSKIFQQEIPNVMNVDNVSILSEAKQSAHPSPIKPNPKMNIAISFVVSLMAAVGLIFLLEYMDDTIKTEADVAEFLDLPTLSMITKIKEEDLATAQKSKTPSQQVGDNAHVNATLRQ